MVCYSCSREDVVEALSRFSFNETAAALVPDHTIRASDREYENKLVNRILVRYTRRLIMPHALRIVWCSIKAARHVIEGLRALWHGEINVAVLDATAITVSLVRGDHETASSVMFLLGVGDLLEEWAHKKSVEDLAGMMALNVDKAWIDDAGTERLVSVNDIAAGDIALGVFGVITPATSAMLHNLSTIGISVYNMTDLIEDR